MTGDASTLDQIELYFPVQDGFGFDERDEIEEALDSALRRLALGDVCGSGAGLGFLDLAIAVDEGVGHERERVIAAVLETVRALHFPASSYLLAYPGSERAPL